MVNFKNFLLKKQDDLFKEGGGIEMPGDRWRWEWQKHILGELNGVVPSGSGPVKWDTERMEHAMISGEPLTQ